MFVFCDSFNFHFHYRIKQISPNYAEEILNFGQSLHPEMQLLVSKHYFSLVTNLLNAKIMLLSANSLRLHNIASLIMLIKL